MAASGDDFENQLRSTPGEAPPADGAFFAGLAQAANTSLPAVTRAKRTPRSHGLQVAAVVAAATLVMGGAAAAVSGLRSDNPAPPAPPARLAPLSQNDDVHPIEQPPETEEPETLAPGDDQGPGSHDAEGQGEVNQLPPTDAGDLVAEDDARDEQGEDGDHQGEDGDHEQSDEDQDGDHQGGEDGDHEQSDEDQDGDHEHGDQDEDGDHEHGDQDEDGDHEHGDQDEDGDHED